VVVPALNAAATIGDCMDALALQDIDRDAYEVIVVDNGSTDDTARIAAESAAMPLVLRRPPGQAAGVARNHGVAAARGSALAFTDADCIPQPGWLRAGLEALADADLIQGAVRPDRRTRAGAFDRTVWVVGESGLYETANLFVRSEFFERAGGFEDWSLGDIAVPFGEDTWFGWRARRAGARSDFCPESVVHHAVFPRSPRGYVAERRRWALFPALARRVPELRRQLFFGRVFLGSRPAAFDAAVVSAVVAGVAWSALPLLGAAPYVAISSRRALRFRRYPLKVFAVDVVADAVGFASLVSGSMRHRSLVL
jgi:glycosyltransferase involved in cell wall biosynthesis